MQVPIPRITVYYICMRKLIRFLTLVRANNTLSPPKILENGVPQGSVLSVSLFLIAINDIFYFITNPVMGLLFADDLTLVCKGKNPHTTQILLQETLDKLQKWTQTSGFTFSSIKSETIIFSRKLPQI